MRRVPYRRHLFCCILFSGSIYLSPASVSSQTPEFSDARTWIGHDGDVTAVAFSPDGQTLVSAGADEVLKLWDAQRGHLRGTFRGHAGPVWTVVFSPDGQSIVSGSEDRTVKIWNVASRKAGSTLTAQAPVYAVALSSDRLWLATAGGDRQVMVWNFRQPGRADLIPDQADLNGGIAFIAGGLARNDLLIVPLASRSVLLWDPYVKEPAGMLAGASSPIGVSPDGRWLASGSGRDHTVVLWDLEQRARVAAFPGHENLVSAVHFSPDGRWLVSGSWDHTIRIWNVSTRQLAHTLNEARAVWSTAFSPDGAMLVAGESEGVLKRWNVRGVSPSIATAPAPAPLPRTIDDNVDNAVSSVSRRPDALGVILGIEDYRYAPAVSYARRDATVMREYFIKTLGLKESNVYMRTDRDATQGEFRKVFDPERGWLAKRITPGKTEVFVYFVGHGAPDVSTGDAFLMPSDGDPNYPATSYQLNELYRSLDRLDAGQVTVILDACFSGRVGRGRDIEMLLAGARGIAVEPRQMQVGDRTVVLAASAGNQVSSSYPEKSHGLFTYFFMMGLRGAADGNADRAITVGELHTYVREYVSSQAGRLDREQTPELIGDDVRRVLVRY